MAMELAGHGQGAGVELGSESVHLGAGGPEVFSAFEGVDLGTDDESLGVAHGDGNALESAGCAVGCGPWQLWGDCDAAFPGP